MTYPGSWRISVNDFFIVVAVLFVLLPIAALVMLINLSNRQSQQHLETGRQLRNLTFALDEQRKLLQSLLQRIEPPAASVARQAIFEAQGEATEQVLPDVVIAESVVDEAEVITAPAQPVATAPASQPAWQSTPWQAPPPSRFELAAKQILQQIWNWIIVGEGHRPAGGNIEYAVASNWLLRVGVLILVTGIGFFLKYSIDNGLLGEQARVALTVLAGVGMIVGGVRLVGRQYHLFSQGLLGGGIAVLYFSVFAAHSFYHLLGVYPSFALMLLVTVSAAILAIRLDSMLVAIFAIIGGYCTPILLSTGQVNFVGLFSYMLLLGSGILAINLYKQWHLLNFLSFFFNYLLFFASMQSYQVDYFWQVMPFLTGFFMLFSTMVFLFCLVNRQKSTLLDLIALIVNASIFFATAYHLIDSLFGQIWTAMLAVALAAFYVAHVYYCLARRVADKELLLSFIGMAAFFVTISLPLLLSKQWITVSWSLQALVMLWMAGKLRSAFLQQVAYLLYGIVLLRFCFADLPDQYGMLMDSQQPFSEFLLGLLERAISFGTPIASLALAHSLIDKPVLPSALACSEGSDVPLWMKDAWWLKAVFIVGAGMVFVVLHLELLRSFGYLYPPLQLPVLTVLWLAMAVLMLSRFLAGAGDWLLQGFRLFLIAVMLKLLLVDLPSWDLTMVHVALDDSVWTLRYSGAYSFQLAAMRLLDFAAIIVCLQFAQRRLRVANVDSGNMGMWLAGSSLVLLFSFLSLEVNSMLYQYVPGLRSGGVSILWAVFALTLVFKGIKRQISMLRMIGLGLFALVAWKVFFIDLARLEQLYRILAFIVLGMLALGGAFLYMRYQQNFTGNTADGKSS